MIGMHIEMAITNMQTLVMYYVHGVNSEEKNRAVINSLNKATIRYLLERPIALYLLKYLIGLLRRNRGHNNQ
jgi:hypothetical protein